MKSDTNIQQNPKNAEGVSQQRTLDIRQQTNALV